MVGAINTAIRRGPDTLERISDLKVAVQATAVTMFVLLRASTTVYFEENSRVIMVKFSYLIHVNKHCIILQIPFLFQSHLGHVQCILIVSSRMSMVLLLS
jgi:hypothetical protein